MNPLALALLYPGLGGSPLYPAVLPGDSRIEVSGQAGLSPRLSAGIGLVHPGRAVGEDIALRGSDRFLRLDPGLWLKLVAGQRWGVGARIGAIAAVSRFADPWFGGQAAAQVATQIGDDAALSVSAGAEVVTGIYIESGIGPHPYPLADARVDWSLGPSWNVSVGVGYPHLVGASLSTRL